MIEGTTAHDIIYGGLGNDIIKGTLDGYLGGSYQVATNQIFGGEGDDILSGNGLLDGGVGSDNLSGNGELRGGQGNDYLVGYGILNGGDGNDEILGNGQLIGGQGNDLLTLRHFEENSSLKGGDGADILIGGDDRRVFINSGSQMTQTSDGYYLARNNAIPEAQRVIYFEGGKDGTFGDDVYLFNLGDGKDTVIERPLGQNYTNVALSYDIVRFGAGIASTDISFERSTDDLRIKHINGNDEIVIKNYFIGPNGHYKIDEVQFADGTSLDQSFIENNLNYFGSSSADTIWGYRGNDTIFAGAGNDHVQSQAGNDKVYGEDGNDSLFGESGDDTLNGGAGDDYIDGGAGNDTYIFSKGGGTDTLSFTDLQSATDTLRLTGIAANDLIAQRFSGQDSIYFSIRGTNDHFWLSDYYAASTGSGSTLTDSKVDRIVFDSGVIWTGTDIQALVDRAAADRAPTVNQYPPTLNGSQGSLFSYTFAANTIVDPDVWDTVTYSITTTTQNATTGQFDPIPSWLTFDPNTRTLSGTPTSTTIGTLQFYLWGTDIYGKGTGAGVTLKVTQPNRPPVIANPVPDQTFADGRLFSYTIAANAFTDPEGDTLTYQLTQADGSALPTWLTFNTTTRVLSGTSPDNTSASITLKITAKDIVGNTTSDLFDLKFTLQNLTINGTSGVDILIGGSGNDMLTGLAGNDTLKGSSGNDTLDGGTGNDTLMGGTGNDLYIVDSATDVITENANEGTDSVQSSVTYTLAANVENLTLTGITAINGTGNASNNVLIGNSAVNTLTGGAGDDTLDGGAGNDTLIGGIGNDLYMVDSATDVITENTNEGTDTVKSSVTYTLAANVENLTLTGTTAINGIGNTLSNTLIGNNAANTLDGGAGIDTLIGGLGDDLYVVDNISDIITENVSEGTDSVQSSITYTLGTNVENLTLTGTTAINGTGNALNNVLMGNSAVNTLTGGAGDDTLNGGAGNDTMVGGIGNDLYMVDSATDVITENANEGTDSVQSSVAYTLGTNVENLTLTGTIAINGTGNTLANSLIGNSGVNTLTGGLGNDIYNLSRSSSNDSIVENDTTAGNQDVLQMTSDIRASQLWFRKMGTDLEVRVIGTSNSATIKNWYTANQYHVELFKSGDGKSLTDAKVQNLVNAMASMTPPATGQTDLSASYQTTLNPVLAANWT